MRLSLMKEMMNLPERLFFILCFIIFAAGSIHTQEKTGDVRAPNWKIAVLKKSGGAYESVPFHQPLNMNRRDVFHLYLAFDLKCCCYVIQENDEGKLPLVFRKAVSPGDKFILPGEEQDFAAASLSGTTRLYVIVSPEPRPNLERLIDLYEQESDKISLERSILSEVLAIRRNVPPSHDPEEASQAGTDPAVRGQIRLFGGDTARVVTITVRAQ